MKCGRGALTRSSSRFAMSTSKRSASRQSKKRPSTDAEQRRLPFSALCHYNHAMENREIARILHETAQLLEIDGAIIGRYRSYEKAAEMINSLPERIEELAKDREKLTELPGIGDNMADHIDEILKTGDYALRAKLLKKYPVTLLDVISLQSLGPKKAALLWKKFKAGSVEAVAKLAREQKLRDVPGFGEKSEENILKAVEFFQRSTGRFRIDVAEKAAEQITAYIQKLGKQIQSVTPAGSLRRGKETIGDLDFVVIPAGKHSHKSVEAVFDHILKYPPIQQVLAHGENKISFLLPNGMQVDVRVIAPESYGAARPRQYDGLHAQRVRALDSQGRQERRQPHRNRDLHQTRSSLYRTRAARTHRRNRSRRSRQAPQARHARQHSRRSANAHHRLRRQTFHRRNGPSRA